MHLRRFYILLILLLFGAAAIGCNREQATPPPQEESPLNPQGAVLESPLATTETQAPPPTGAEGFTAATPVPVTPAADNGVVTGVLLQNVRGLPISPVVNTKLFLAKIITDAEGQIELASLDENAAPQSVTNDQGQFTFIGIAPGKYALIIRTPIQAILAHDVVEDADVLATVVAGEVVALGEVHVEMGY